LYYSTDNGVTYPNVIDDSGTVLASAGNPGYSWNNIPNTPGSQIKVKVADTVDGDVTAGTDVYAVASPRFNVIANITVSQPDGTGWLVSDNYNIVASVKGAANVDAHYSLNSGTSWIAIGLGNYAVVADSVSIPWTIPDKVQDGVLVRVVKAGENPLTTTQFGDSTTFPIYDKITAIAPSGGTAITTGSSATQITWTSASAGMTSSLGTVNIYLSADNGATWTAWSSLGELNDGSADFTAPSLHSVNCKVKIESTINSANSEVATAFVIRDDITVTTPDVATPAWLVGQTYTIDWTYTGPATRSDGSSTPLTVSIEYSYDGTPGNYATLATGVSIGAAGTGSWEWTIGGATALGTTGSIRVTDSYIALSTDESEGNLTVQGNVTPDELLAGPYTVDDPLNLTWAISGAVNFVNLYYSKDGSSGPWVAIDDSGTWPAGTQPYNWTVPDALTETFHIRMDDAQNPAVSNVTVDANIRIIGKITLDKPDTAEPDWVVGDPVDIKFTPTGTYSVLIEGSTNGFSDELENWTIATISSASITSGVQYTHNYASIEDHISAGVKVRVSDTARPTEVKDVSAEAFTIKGNLTIDTPTDVPWYVGDTNRTIQWTQAGSVGNVKIEYFNGTIWQDVTASEATGVTGIYTYDWTAGVGDVKNSGAKLRVSAVN
ncbi:MAG: hypothetical protein KAR42_18140, partial [candidate division Zixibacteria bacterium]|nr:hypothetical protein [candidate division Zixibacteria bacterium]